MVYFNSIKVRLEHGVLIYQPQGAAFQFHKGAIRTKNDIFLEAALYEFQFHKGAIRTQCRNSRCMLSSYFNSIKVRLERKMCTALDLRTRISIP